MKACRFCAFARGHRSEEAYFLGEDEVVRRALEARELGATEVCVQAGLAPGIDGRLYVHLCRAIKAAAPDLHVHAFSPEEVKYGAGLAGVSIRAYLEELKDAGLGSLPGTSAEVLDDAVRAKIAPTRITTAEWIDVVKTAHAARAADDVDDHVRPRRDGRGADAAPRSRSRSIQKETRRVYHRRNSSRSRSSTPSRRCS